MFTNSTSALVPNFKSFHPIFFSLVTHSHFHGLGWGIRHFPVLISGFSMQIWGQDAQRSSRGQPGSNFYIWVQNPMGLLNINFYPYPIKTSLVIPFLRSIITFSGKRLLTPEGVAGGFSLTGCLFSRFVS